MAVVPYRNACLLSCGVEPSSIRSRSELADSLRAEVEQRIEVAESHLGLDLAAHVLNDDLPGQETGVTLAEFRAWGEALPAPFAFPDEFPCSQAATSAVAVAAPPASKTAPEKALSTRERNTLLRIIGALALEAKIDTAEGGGGAAQIEAAVAAAGFDSPKEQAIRAVLKQVRELSQ